jgi:hypothetical protein
MECAFNFADGSLVDGRRRQSDSCRKNMPHKIPASGDFDAMLPAL